MRVRKVTATAFGALTGATLTSNTVPAPRRTQEP